MKTKHSKKEIAAVLRNGDDCAVKELLNTRVGPFMKMGPEYVPFLVKHSSSISSLSRCMSLFFRSVSSNKRNSGKAKYHELEESVLHGRRINRKKALKHILLYGWAHTAHYNGSGRNTLAVDYTTEVCDELDRLGIQYVKGNLAPRGGVWGKYVVVVMPDFLWEVKPALKKEERIWADERKAAIKAAIKEETERKIMLAKAKAYIKPYHDEIINICNNLAFVNNRLSNRERRLAAKELCERHPGLKPFMVSNGLKTTILKK